MPIYEYECAVCKEGFATLQSVNARTEDTRCPRCGSKDVKKRVSAFSCCSIGGNHGFNSQGGGAFPSSGFSGGFGGG